ncbi:MAG: Ldh family oxidoreductase [Lachnospiraceae bacterium]|nr:Ldh family oxidoreductase [Lachnospiraceae bacterium]
MKKIPIETLRTFITDLWTAWGGRREDAALLADIYTGNSKRRMGHHDIHNLPQRIDAVKNGVIDPKAEITPVASYGAIESWDGHSGAGEISAMHIMKRACDLAEEHGIGFATVRHSNHYLSSAPYVCYAADRGFVGLILAKAGPTMGMPGQKGNLIGQSPMGYAFPTGLDPVMLDICLAYIAYEPLKLLADAGGSVPIHYGVDRDGNPTTSAAELLAGTKYPIGEHKGFGLALLSELLTGVFSYGAILDEGENDRPYRGMTHTAIALKTDALMDRETYRNRADELVKRLRARGEGLHIPGDGSWEAERKTEEAGVFQIEDDLLEKLNDCAKNAPYFTVPVL